MNTELEAECESRIWSGDWAGVQRAAACDPRSWAGSIQASLRATGPAPELWQTEDAFPAFPFCAVLMLIKNEADIIGLNLRWLHHIGVRRFLIMDNNSSDGTRGELQRFQAAYKDADVRLEHDPVVAYLQAVKTTWMYHQARAQWADVRWLLPIDADEFLVARHGVQALAFVPDDIEALTLQKATHFYPFGTFRPEGKVRLDVISMRSQIYLCPPKIILRAGAALGIAAGNHKAVRANGGVTYAGGFSHGFYYREFPTRGFPQFLSKVRNGGAAVLAAQAEGQDVGAQHWLEWYQILRERGEQALRSTYARIAYREAGQGYVEDAFRAISAVM